MPEITLFALSNAMSTFLDSPAATVISMSFPEETYPEDDSTQYPRYQVPAEIRALKAPVLESIFALCHAPPLAERYTFTLSSPKPLMTAPAPSLKNPLSATSVFAIAMFTFLVSPETTATDCGSGGI